MGSCNCKSQQRVPQRTSSTAVSYAKDSTPEAHGPYDLSAKLAPKALRELDDNPNGPIVEREPIQLENGLVYTGQMKGCHRHGRGKLVWPDGAEFIGEWIDNVACGHGVFKQAGPGGDVYEGQWKDDKANGFGILRHKDKFVYEGEWKDDMNHGSGKETWADGSTFEGHYENGRKEGFGVFKWPEGSCYQGEFHANEIHGWGRYDWADGRIYCGQWVNNKMHGFGWFIWPTGQMYRGEYCQDKKHGWGEFLWPDNRVYRGGWKSGKQEGYGISRLPKGEERWSYWENKTRVRWLTPDEVEEKKRTHELPVEPEFPPLPDWLEPLCIQAYPEWYMEKTSLRSSSFCDTTAATENEARSS